MNERKVVAYDICAISMTLKSFSFLNTFMIDIAFGKHGWANYRNIKYESERGMIYWYDWKYVETWNAGKCIWLGFIIPYIHSFYMIYVAVFFEYNWGS